jgi:hypothetical protein
LQLSSTCCLYAGAYYSVIKQTLVSSRKMQQIQFSLLTSRKTSTESKPGVNSVELQRMVPVSPMVEQLSCFLCLSVFDASCWFLQQVQRKQQAAAKRLHFRQMSHSVSCCLTRFLLFSKSGMHVSAFYADGLQDLNEETPKVAAPQPSNEFNPLTQSLVSEDDE